MTHFEQGGGELVALGFQEQNPATPDTGFEGLGGEAVAIGFGRQRIEANQANIEPERIDFGGGAGVLGGETLVQSIERADPSVEFQGGQVVRNGEVIHERTNPSDIAESARQLAPDVPDVPDVDGAVSRLLVGLALIGGFLLFLQAFAKGLGRGVAS